MASRTLASKTHGKRSSVIALESAKVLFSTHIS